MDQRDTLPERGNMCLSPGQCPSKRERKGPLIMLVRHHAEGFLRGHSAPPPPPTHVTGRVCPLGTPYRTGWALHCLRSSLWRFTVFTDRWSRMLNKNTPDIQDQWSELLKSQAKQFNSDVNWFRNMDCKQTWEACWGLATLTQQGLRIYAHT